MAVKATTLSERASPWILGPKTDLALFVATPLAVFPLAALARSPGAASQLALLVAAFGALGHHLPGMMRAYGDRALFDRFKVRFIVAPIFLLGVCIFFTVRDLHALTVVVLLWGLWHGALQVYGFLRIYDAKVRSFGSWTARLDWLVTIGWFGAGLLYSPGRMTSLIEVFYQAGGPLLHTRLYLGFKTAWLATTVGLTIAFGIHFLREWRSGRPVNPVKPLSMAMSYGFWWYTTVVVPNAILGVALFEVFHDIQYLGIVWMFNKNRAEKDPEAGRFTALLFRRSVFMVFIYVGLCFLYGAVRLVPEAVDAELVRKTLLGFVAASTLLHFYFDGFIWKVRERMTRNGLGFDGEGDVKRQGRRVAPWMAHGLKWSAFVLPLVVLGTAQARGIAPSLAQYESMAELVPNSPYVHNNLGVQLKATGDLDRAIGHYEAAVALDPLYARAHSNLGVARLQKNETEAALAALETAVRLDPSYPEARTNLAAVLSRQGAIDEAESHYRRALEHNPQLLEAHNGLGQLLVRSRRYGDAVVHFERAAALDPEAADLHTSLGLALVMSGEAPAALASFERAIDLDADRLVALESAAWILSTRPEGEPGDAERAIELSEHAAELTSYLNASVLDTLGAAYAAAGRFDRAIVAARTASALASDDGEKAQVRDIEARIALYERGEPFREAAERGR